MKIVITLEICGVKEIVEIPFDYHGFDTSFSLSYEAPLSYILEDVCPSNGIKKLKSSYCYNANSNLLFDFFLLIRDGVYGLSAIIFEGCEKRLEVSFFEPSIFQYSKGLGRCALTKSQLDDILTCMHARSCPFSTTISMSMLPLPSPQSPSKCNNNVYTSGKTGSMTDKSGIKNAISTVLVTFEDGFWSAVDKGFVLLGAQETIVVHLSVGMNEYKPEISRQTFGPLGEDSGTVMYQAFEKFGKFCGLPRSTVSMTGAATIAASKFTSSPSSIWILALEETFLSFCFKGGNIQQSATVL
ncbi:hypothetical protein HID58_071416 [Brassica napus]|uniref:Uncharacterized protein n=1 Tax=Brassica napus TaxID=3708 RepID=A0ABQ7Z1K2_BRANA|nr:hypothetical protein HID58_071416 [Brassica napus]